MTVFLLVIVRLAWRIGHAPPPLPSHMGANQINHFRTQGRFTTVSEDMGIDRNEKCNGLYIFTNVANEREFKITAQFGNAVWTVDQTRTIQKIR